MRGGSRVLWLADSLQGRRWRINYIIIWNGLIGGGTVLDVADMSTRSCPSSASAVFRRNHPPSPFGRISRFPSSPSSARISAYSNLTFASGPPLHLVSNPQPTPSASAYVYPFTNLSSADRFSGFPYPTALHRSYVAFYVHACSRMARFSNCRMLLDASGLLTYENPMSLMRMLSIRRRCTHAKAEHAYAQWESILILMAVRK